MGVEVINEQTNIRDVRIELIDEIEKTMGVVEVSTVLSDCDMTPAGKGLEHHEEVSGVLAFILVIEAFYLVLAASARVGMIWCARRRVFIEADGWIGGV